MKQILTKLLHNEELTQQETKQVMLNITEEKYPAAQISAMLSMIQMRGVSVNEVLGFREALLELRVPADLSAYKPIDIVGTGGDGKNTFNISTCACFVVAGAGYKVAKHGNYGATSVSGASNVMEQHGVKFTNDGDVLRRSMDQCGMVYQHAQFFHPAMRFVGPIRKALQVPTVFNLLGPLINPCQPAYQLLGVANLEQMRLYTNIQHRIGIGFGIVNSLDGYDEISLTSEFKVSTNQGEYLYMPEDIGFHEARPEELYGGTTKEEASRIFDDVLMNQATESQKNVVLINAALAIHVIEPKKSISECIDIARQSLESGKALQVLKKFIEINS